MPRQESISVFFPAYNDEHTIGTLVEQSISVIERLGFTDYEVIAINDGSEDGTAAVLARLESDLPQFRAITHPKNRGYGGALRSGFSAACKDLVFYTDGDAQYDVEELPLLLEKLADDVDVVNGYKISRKDFWVRDIVGKLYRSAVCVCSSRHRFETLTVISASSGVGHWSSIHLTMNSGAICLELVAELAATGARFSEVGVTPFPASIWPLTVLPPASYHPDAAGRLSILVSISTGAAGICGAGRARYPLGTLSTSPLLSNCCKVSFIITKYSLSSPSNHAAMGPI